MTGTNNCPCTSGNAYAECCEPFISGAQKPKTAETMMRARYTAHTQANIDFIVATHHPDSADEINQESTRRWAAESDWLGLEILRTEKGGEEDRNGIVEFVAQYRDRSGDRHRHHEISLFDKVNGEWRFRDAEAPKVGQIKRDTPKVGRNDPCPCGSGKKYKKCCG